MASIYADAAKLRKSTNKKDAEALIVALAERLPNERAELARLLSFFMPTAPRGKTVEAWVALAAAKKDRRKYLNWVYATGEFIVASDGHRLHGAPSTLEPGFYDPATMVRTWGADDPDGPGAYPNWRRLVPERSVMPVAALGLTQHSKELTKVEQGEICAHFNSAYIEQALQRSQFASLEDSRNSILLQGEGGTFAVVMPIRPESVK